MSERREETNSKLGWDALPYQPDSPEITLSDYHWFNDEGARHKHVKKDLQNEVEELDLALRKLPLEDSKVEMQQDSYTRHDLQELPSPTEIVLGLKSADLVEKVVSAHAARHVLSRLRDPPISELIGAGAIKPLVDALDRDDCPALQFDASWALSNIASGTHEHTMAVIDGGAIPKFVRLISHGGEVAEQSIWALGNIAGDGAAARDLLLSQGVLQTLLPSLHVNTTLSQLRIAAWTIAVASHPATAAALPCRLLHRQCSCVGQRVSAPSKKQRTINPEVDFKLVSPVLPYIADLLYLTEEDILADACWSLAFLTNGPEEWIEEVQTTRGSVILMTQLVKLMDHKSLYVCAATLRTVCNMLKGSHIQKQRCLDAGCLDYLAKFLDCGNPPFVNESAGAVGSIFAGSQSQRQKAFEKGILLHLAEVIDKEKIGSKKEAARAISKLCLYATPEQMDSLTCSGAMEPYYGLLRSTDPEADTIVREGLANLQRAAAQNGQMESFHARIKEIGALDILESQ